jgi:hypothetical protein
VANWRNNGGGERRENALVTQINLRVLTTLNAGLNEGA